MGIEPTYPSEKYGYIIPESGENVSKVMEFKEKPDVETAKKYLAQSALWNAGIFAFKLGYLLDKAHSMIDFEDYRDLFNKYDTLTKISFDYAVVEKESSIQVLRYSGDWKDVGTWNMMAEVMADKTKGKAVLDETCENTNVVNELNAKKTKQVLFNTNYWKYGLSISLPLVIHTFSQQILSQFDRIMIGALVSVVAVGIYGFIQTIASILQIIVQSMDNAWSVWMYEQLDQKQYTQIQDKSKAYILLMNILYVGFISLAPDVIHIAGTKEYYDGISMVIPLSFAIYFIFLYSLPVHIEYFYKKTKFIATGTSLAAGINIALNYFFIRSYGYTASAWTTLASYFLLFVFHWFIAKKIDGNPMFPKKTIIGSIIALSTFSAWTILIINHMLIRWISMLLFIVLSLICNSKTILPLTDKLASKLKNG